MLTFIFIFTLLIFQDRRTSSFVTTIINNTLKRVLMLRKTESHAWLLAPASSTRTWNCTSKSIWSSAWNNIMKISTFYCRQLVLFKRRLQASFLPSWRDCCTGGKKLNLICWDMCIDRSTTEKTRVRFCKIIYTPNTITRDLGKCDWLVMNCDSWMTSNVTQGRLSRIFTFFSDVFWLVFENGVSVTYFITVNSTMNSPKKRY